MRHLAQQSAKHHLQISTTTFDTNQSDIDQAASQLTNITVHTTSQVVPLKVNFIQKRKQKRNGTTKAVSN